MPHIPGPYEVGAPDGNRYFAILGPQIHLLNGYKLLLEARQIAVSMGGGEGRARALAIDEILAQTQRQVDTVAVQTAAVATQAIVAHIKARQLRPDPPGKSSGTRLQDSIHSRAIKTFPSGGAVGIGDLDVLAGVVGDDGGEYWRAQEFGSSHMVGRTLRGVFQPGDAVPTKADFRVHPVFEVGGQASFAAGAGTGGFSPKMYIQNPIPEKAFLREGGYDAAVYRRDAFRAVEQTAIAELRLVQSGNHPRIAAARGFLRGRTGR